MVDDPHSEYGMARDACDKFASLYINHEWKEFKRFPWVLRLIMFGTGFYVSEKKDDDMDQDVPLESDVYTDGGR